MLRGAVLPFRAFRFCAILAAHTLRSMAHGQGRIVTMWKDTLGTMTGPTEPQTEDPGASVGDDPSQDTHEGQPTAGEPPLKSEKIVLSNGQVSSVSYVSAPPTTPADQMLEEPHRRVPIVPAGQYEPETDQSPPISLDETGRFPDGQHTVGEDGNGSSEQ